MNQRFRRIPLLSDDKYLRRIEDFVVDREKDYSKRPDDIIGLEAYLKKSAEADDFDNKGKIYLIVDDVIEDIAAYFGLKAGMVANSTEEPPSDEEKEYIMSEFGAKLLPDTVPGIEISHFAVNDNYRRKIQVGDTPIKGLGKYFYPEFIYPLIEKTASIVGVHMAYLYAAGDEKLINYYKEVFKFQMLDEGDDYMPLQPVYDGGCPFMYRVL